MIFSNRRASSEATSSIMSLTPGLSSDLSRWRRSPPSDLLHEEQKIGHTPMFRDLPVTHPHDIDCFELDLAMGWSDAQERPFMRAVIGLVGRHAFTIGKLPVNLGMKIRKGLAHVGVELPDASLIGRCSGLGGVIDEIVREKFLENIEVSLALNL